MITRRNIFRLAACAVAASAMDIMGWSPPKMKINPAWEEAAYEFILDPSIFKRMEKKMT